MDKPSNLGQVLCDRVESEMETTETNISKEHWTWVRDLINEVEREEKRDEFLKRLFQWDLAVKAFRRAEMALIILGNPDENDFHDHAICLHSLLAIGHSLIMVGAEFKEEEFEHLQVRHANVSAYVEELERSYREWHSGFRAEEIEAAKSKLFGGAP